jgi:hypothetical protein
MQFSGNADLFLGACNLGTFRVTIGKGADRFSLDGQIEGASGPLLDAFNAPITALPAIVFRPDGADRAYRAIIYVMEVSTQGDTGLGVFRTSGDVVPIANDI